MKDESEIECIMEIFLNNLCTIYEKNKFLNSHHLFEELLNKFTFEITNLIKNYTYIKINQSINHNFQCDLISSKNREIFLNLGIFDIFDEIINGYIIDEIESKIKSFSEIYDKQILSDLIK